MCKLGTISQEQLKIEVELLLSTNRKLYMSRRLVQQWMTLSDLEWPFHASRAISGVAELVVNCRCCFSLWKVNLTLHCIVTVAAYIGCKVPLCILCRSTLSCTTWPTIS